MALLFDQYPSALSQQAAYQHQQAIVPRNQTRQAQPSSMPNIPTGLLNQVLGGSTGVGSATGASAGGTGFGLGQPLVAGEIGSASYAGGAGAGASSAGGLSSIGSAGPWAALAAVILANENYQTKKGNRPDDTGKHLWQLLSGDKLIEQDAETIGEKIDSGNKLGLKGDYQLLGDISSFDFSNAFKNLDDTVVGKLFGGLF